MTGYVLTANAWEIAIGCLVGTGTFLMVRTGIKLVWQFVEQAMRL